MRCSSGGAHSPCRHDNTARPPVKNHVVERRIMWGDLDSLGIVFYPRYYEWIDACGHLLFESLNVPMGDVWRERKILFGLVETSCRYFLPGKYHETIRIATHIDSLEEKLVVLKHMIHRAVSGELMVEGIEKRICMDVRDPDRVRAIPIPADIFSVLADAMAP